MSKFINANCLDVMRQYPDAYFDLAIVDPPYFSGPEKRKFYGRKISPKQCLQIAHLKNGAEIEASPQEMELLLLVSSLGKLAQKLHKHIFHSETQLPFIRPELLSLHSSIHAVAIHNLTTADSCLQLAYDEIKDRKGKIIDGVFVKEADLG